MNLAGLLPCRCWRAILGPRGLNPTPNSPKSPKQFFFRTKAGGRLKYPPRYPPSFFLCKPGQIHPLRTAVFPRPPPIGLGKRERDADADEAVQHEGGRPPQHPGRLLDRRRRQGSTAASAPLRLPHTPRCRSGFNNSARNIGRLVGRGVWTRFVVASWASTPALSLFDRMPGRSRARFVSEKAAEIQIERLCEWRGLLV